ncbi:MAG: response regulator [Spirochaetales bacterium]|nr:response regulator [Spirochaetales bacterium]
MKKKIMIVDDSPITTRQLKHIFEEAGHEVVRTASSGLEAVKTYQEHMQDIDLVTLDITMPTMAGTRVLELIMEANPAARVVMVSAIGKESIIKECLKNGAKHFIVKPFDASRVLEVMATV